MLKVLEPVTYKLDFSESIQITQIRHILVLELADPKAPLMKDIPDIDPKSQEKLW